MTIARTVLLAATLAAAALGCKKRQPPTEPDTPQPAVVAPAPKVNLGPEAARKRGTFTVGKDTTYVTGPLDATGHVDYVAALNERLSKGVTPETNANVAIWNLIGPAPANGSVPPGYFEKLGIPAPPAAGRYHVGLQAYGNRVLGPSGAGNMSDLLKPCTERPWVRNQSDVIAGWLETNDVVLTSLRDAVKRSQYFSPLVPGRTDKGSKGLVNASLPSIQACRELASALAARAMLHVGNGRPDEAWQDVLACYRLGRLVGRGGVLIEGLVGVAIEQIACRAAVAYIYATKSDAKTVEACIRDLFALAPPAAVADKIDGGERYMYLDHVMQVNLQGSAYLMSLGDEMKGPSPLTDAALDGTDWDAGLRSANVWYDKLTAAARENRRSGRVQALAKFDADMKALAATARDPGRLAQLIASGKPEAKAKGEAFGEAFLTLFMPAAGKVIDAQDRCQQMFDVTVTAFALAGYQRANGRYPASLADLAPTFLKAVPADLFSGKDLIYKPNANGFLLYGVGVNGIDDGGSGHDSNPPGDDIAVLVPLPKR